MDYIHDLYRTNVTKTTHIAPYPAISPSLPALSQAGKTVLVTGGGTGIGLGISRAFVQASASTVIIVGRRADKLAQACEELEATAKQAGMTTNIIGRSTDLNDVGSIKALWDSFKDEGIVVDVLVSNAVKFQKFSEILALGAEEVWSQFETNVRAPLFLLDGFSKQGEGRPKAFINISTQFIQFDQSKVTDGRRAYCLTKGSGTLLAQQVAKEVSPDDMQIISVHPGVIWTDDWENTGIARDALPFADAAVPGQVAVWAASPEARFLHGRFIWASWDVDELKEGPIRQNIDNDPDFLTMSVMGLKLGNLA